MQQKEEIPTTPVDARLTRVAKGLTVRAVARRAGMNVSTLSRIERGLTKHPSAGVMVALSAVYGCSPDALLAGVLLRVEERERASRQKGGRRQHPQPEPTAAPALPPASELGWGPDWIFGAVAPPPENNRAGAARAQQEW